MAVRDDYEGRRPSEGELHANGDCYSSSCRFCDWEDEQPRPCQRCKHEFYRDDLEDDTCLSCAVALGWTDPPEEGT